MAETGFQRLLPCEERLEISESEDNALAISAARRVARNIGFGESDEFLFATVVSELATNILRYAGKGQVVIRSVRSGDRVGVEVTAMDSGPGIADIEKAMRDHYTTGGGLGLGLPSVKRIMDVFCLDSKPGRGTVCTARKWLERLCP